MKEAIIRTIVFFVLITVIALSMIGTWRVITIDVQENKGSAQTIIPESNTGSGYVSIDIIGSENIQENE